MIRSYQIIARGEQAPDQAIFEGTIEEADNVYGLRIGATESDLVSFVENAYPDCCIRFRDFKNRSEFEQYYTRKADEYLLFYNIVGVTLT